LLPVGGAIIADRYTYIPYVGIFFILAFYMNQLIENKKTETYKKAIVTSGLVVILIFSHLSNIRCKVWSNSITLWNDVLSKQTTSPKAYNNRGDAYNIAKQYESAIEDLNKSIELKYDYPDAYYNRGLSHYYLGNYENAINDYSNAIKYNPTL